MINIPPFPHHLSASDRAAVQMKAAGEIAEATIADGGLDRQRVDMQRLRAEAAACIAQAWLSERITAIEKTLQGLTASQPEADTPKPGRKGGRQ